MLKKLILTAALALSLPLAAHAVTLSSVGPRIGLSTDPDQLVVGGQLNTSEFANDLTFNPNLELGIGDDVTVVAVNFDMQYHMAIQGSDWRPYVGFGLGANFISVDLPAPLNDESDTAIALNLALGTNVPTSSGNPFFGEIRFQIGDADLPSLKLMFGMNFPLK